MRIAYRVVICALLFLIAFTATACNGAGSSARQDSFSGAAPPVDPSVQLAAQELLDGRPGRFVGYSLDLGDDVSAGMSDFDFEASYAFLDLAEGECKRLQARARDQGAAFQQAGNRHEQSAESLRQHRSTHASAQREKARALKMRLASDNERRISKDHDAYLGRIKSVRTNLRAHDSGVPQHRRRGEGPRRRSSIDLTPTPRERSRRPRRAPGGPDMGEGPTVRETTGGTRQDPRELRIDYGDDGPTNSDLVRDGKPRTRNEELIHTLESIGEYSALIDEMRSALPNARHWLPDRQRGGADPTRITLDDDEIMGMSGVGDDGGPISVEVDGTDEQKAAEHGMELLDEYEEETKQEMENAKTSRDRSLDTLYLNPTGESQLIHQFQAAKAEQRRQQAAAKLEQIRKAKEKLTEFTR